jgi:hypothetical protein
MDKSVGIVVGIALALWLAYLVIFLLTRACMVAGPMRRYIHAEIESTRRRIRLQSEHPEETLRQEHTYLDGIEALLGKAEDLVR